MVVMHSLDGLRVGPGKHSMAQTIHEAARLTTHPGRKSPKSASLASNENARIRYQLSLDNGNDSNLELVGSTSDLNTRTDIDNQSKVTTIRKFFVEHFLHRTRRRRGRKIK